MQTFYPLNPHFLPEVGFACDIWWGGMIGGMKNRQISIHLWLRRIGFAFLIWSFVLAYDEIFFVIALMGFEFDQWNPQYVVFFETVEMMPDSPVLDTNTSWSIYEYMPPVGWQWLANHLAHVGVILLLIQWGLEKRSQRKEPTLPPTSGQQG